MNLKSFYCWKYYPHKAGFAKVTLIPKNNKILSRKDFFKFPVHSGKKNIFKREMSLFAIEEIPQPKDNKIDPAEPAEINSLRYMTRAKKGKRLFFVALVAV